MTRSSIPPKIGPITPDKLPRTLALAFNRLEPAAREGRVNALLDDIRAGRISADGILAAWRGDRIVGAIFAQTQIGRTAVTWPPSIVAGEPRRTLDSLMQATLRRLADEDVQVVHALLDFSTAEDNDLLCRAGFQRLANLIYLVSETRHFPAVQPKGPLEFENYTPDVHDRLAAIVDATYQDTLDCPALNGVREIEDILSGYRATSGFRPELWMIVRHQDRCVGCLLLADHPEHENCELVYMGILPDARGNGWGVAIARHAQWIARQLDRSRLVLAVDEANLPARNLYTSIGFHGWDRRTVYLKVI
jgi:ribosomal protein S18 acetylase RimI-like enzyme